MIASFVNYSRQFSRPISQMANLVNTILSAIAGAERVFAIMDEQPDVTNKPNALSVTKFAGDVAFENVSFGYNDEKMILKDVTLTAKKGEMVALVGPTGSGKTTIINLLTRFYDISNGDIKIDGRSISDYNIHDLRNRIGIVLQDTYLFSGTIADNIRFGRLDASDEEVKSAAKMANAHSFIKHLPQQYNTVISAGGGNLSEGQKQLLSIARAMLSDCDILILDEATSNIDTKTEIDIQRGMSNLLKGKTSFVIAHRLKTIENADQILVLKDGQIIEEGNHRELLEKQGFYHKLYTQQFTI
jgi:ATP-binding cassette subfamily B protein